MILTTPTNIYQGGNGSALIYDKIAQIHIVNKTSSPATFTMYLGATGASAAGTELFVGVNIPANGYFDWFTPTKLVSTEFLVGFASVTLALTITIMTEQFVV
jgi:hypothetical protein